MATSKQRQRFERTRYELARLGHRGLERTAFLRKAASLLQQAVPFDGARWNTVDPTSLLITSHHTNLSGEGFKFICRNEYLPDARVLRLLLLILHAVFWLDGAILVFNAATAFGSASGPWATRYAGTSSVGVAVSLIAITFGSSSSAP